jgi:hypothetical protein
MTSRANAQVWLEPSYRAWVADDIKLIFHRWKVQVARQYRDRLFAAWLMLGIASDAIGVLAKLVAEWGER